MKSILLKTLAATSLVATTRADVHVMGASFKERGVNAPNGTIITNPGTVRATRGYLIMDQTVTSTLPNLATYIEYGEIRGGGVTERFYTIDTDFAAFHADGVLGSSGGRRLYGHMYAPVTIADVANPLIPFSGTTFSSNLPKKLTFDQTVFQTGASDALAGPRILVTAPSTLRSVISGSANHVKVAATDISEATDELVARLVKQGYGKILGEVPEITSTFPAALPLQDGETEVLTVTLDPDVFPGTGDTFSGPTYQWYKDNVAIPTGVGPSLTITGGTSTATDGAGTYRVVVTNDLGSAASTNVVVSSVTNEFTTNLPAALTIQGADTSVLSVVLNPVPVVPPAYQWFKGTAPIAAADGGTGATLSVTGGAAATGAGTYRVEITNSAGTLVSGNTVVAVNNVAMSFTTNLTTPVAVPFAGSAVLAPVVNANALPKVASYQWSRSTTVGGTYTAIAAGDGGTQPTLTVYGDSSRPTGPGFFYRVVVTNSAPTPQTITSASAQVTVAPPAP